MVIETIWGSMSSTRERRDGKNNTQTLPKHQPPKPNDFHQRKGAITLHDVYNKVLREVNLLPLWKMREGIYLATMATSCQSISCDLLSFGSACEGTCWSYIISKACQYATNDVKVCFGFREVLVTDVQASLQKTTTWTKKIGKGRIEWNKACVDSSLRPRKLKTLVKIRFASKVIMFEETLEFKEAIVCCYRHQSFTLQQQVPKPQIWAIAEALTCKYPKSCLHFM